LSARCTFKDIFAYDASGNRYLVTQEYFYANDGRYHERVDIKDKFYDLTSYAADEKRDTVGTYLPYTYPIDCKSYFTQAPTKTIQTVLSEAELTGIEITSFLLIMLRGDNTDLYEAVGCRITPEGVTDIEFDIQNADYTHDVDLTLNIVLTMAELEDQ
jgi:hypothetical protein